MFYYIDYEGLKRALRAHRTWDEDAEQEFVQQLENELDKVYSFTTVKSDEIVRRIAASEKEVDEVLSRAERNGGNAAEDGSLEDDFELLEEDLSDVIADVHDLAKFAQLNYTGFQKIIKKHDVGFLGARWFAAANNTLESYALGTKACIRNPTPAETILQGQL